MSRQTQCVIENSVVKTALHHIEIPNVDFGTFMRGQWSRDAENTALVDEASGATCTYAEFERECLGVAAGMRYLGFRPGYVAAIASANSLDMVVALFATVFAGGKVTFIKTNLTEREIEKQLLKIRPSIFFCDEECAEKVSAASRNLTTVTALVVFGAYKKMVQFATFKNTTCDQFQRPETVDPNETLFTFYTSGTTGHPKAALLTHKNYVAQVFGLISSRSLFTEAEEYIGLMPFAHPLGLCILCAKLALGHKTVTLSSMRIERFFAAVQSCKNAMLMLYPTYVRYLVEAGVPESIDLNEVRAILIGGNTTAEKFLKELSRVFPSASVVCGYGLTEAAAAAAYHRWACSDPSCAGPPILSLEMKVVDVITKKALGPKECGEICIRGPTLFKGYLDMPEATAEAFDASGFFLTGDTGYYTEDGHFHVSGRIKDLIKCMDQQVAPAELEALLLSHPEVKEAVVAGVPHPEFGEAARAFIVLRSGRREDHAVKESLQSFVTDMVAYHKQLHGGVEFLDKVPATDTGKALRRHLCETYLKESTMALQK